MKISLAGAVRRNDQIAARVSAMARFMRDSARSSAPEATLVEVDSRGGFNLKAHGDESLLQGIVNVARDPLSLLCQQMLASP
jgi:hypothetical protein